MIQISTINKYIVYLKCIESASFSMYTLNTFFNKFVIYRKCIIKKEYIIKDIYLSEKFFNVNYR